MENLENLENLLEKIQIAHSELKDAEKELNEKILEYENFEMNPRYHELNVFIAGAKDKINKLKIEYFETVKQHIIKCWCCY